MAHHPGATYLLSTGQVATGSYPVCFQTHATYERTPPDPDTGGDGLWAEIAGEDPANLDAIRVVAWLSPEGEARLRAGGGLHSFRGALRTRYPDAQVMRYRRRGDRIAREQVIILEHE